MHKSLIAILLLTIFGIAIANETVSSRIVTYKTKGDYAIVRDNLEIAITGQGLVISGILHVQKMLDRTAKDLGYTKKLYLAAESFEFCSASISHQMTLADPRNIAICPFTISIFQLVSDPKHIYLVYRKPILSGESDKIEQKALKLLDDISREAIE